MEKISITARVHTPTETVWHHFTTPSSITGWAFADPSWESPHAENDLQVGGRFLTRMQAKDGSAGFDFTGTYTQVAIPTHITYEMDKAPGESTARVCEITFTDNGDGTTQVTEVCDPEHENPLEMQQAGWQSILNNFASFVESHK